MGANFYNCKHSKRIKEAEERSLWGVKNEIRVNKTEKSLSQICATENETYIQLSRYNLSLILS